MLLLPEAGVGICPFTNRTYTGASGPVWDAALALLKADALPWRDTPVSPALAAAHDAARAIYAAGDVAPSQARLAMNFLLDRSAEGWKADLAALRGQIGACPTAEPVHATGALSGAFRWNCERGRLDGQLLLAPTDPPTIQSLRLRAEVP